jgi:lysozyme family protein
VKTLQAVIGASVDGLWGAETAAKVAAITDVEGAIKAYAVKREAFYQSLSTYRYFGADWSRRTSEIETEAEAIEEKAEGGNAPAV